MMTKYHVYGLYRDDNENRCLLSGTLEDCRMMCRDMDKSQLESLNICDYGGRIVEWYVIYGKEQFEVVR